MATATQEKVSEVSELLKSNFPGKRFGVSPGGEVWPNKDPSAVVVNHDAYMTDEEVAKMHELFNNMENPPALAVARMVF